MRQLRKMKQLTIKQVCEALRVSPQALGKWEHGICLPTVDNLFAISRLYETGIDNVLVEAKSEK